MSSFTPEAYSRNIEQISSSKKTKKLYKASGQGSKRGEFSDAFELG